MAKRKTKRPGRHVEVFSDGAWVRVTEKPLDPYDATLLRARLESVEGRKTRFAPDSAWEVAP